MEDEITSNSDTHNNVRSSWDGVQPGVPQGLVLGLCLSLVCIGDLPHSVIAISNPVLSADDTVYLSIF
jgi:hypothetical protein